MRFIGAISILFLTTVAIGCSDSSPIGIIDPNGIVEGAVVALDGGAPVPGVRIRLQPGGMTATTGPAGDFRVSGLQSGVTYTLQTGKEGFSDVVTSFVLDAERPRLDLRIELPPFDRIVEPDHPMRIWTSVVDGGLGRPSITYAVEIENRGGAPLEELTIQDVLDEDVGYRLQAEDFQVNPVVARAAVEIHDDGRSFAVTPGRLAPTDGPVEVVRFTIPSPDADIFCNRVHAGAELDGVGIEHEDNVCLVVGWL